MKRMNWVIGACLSLLLVGGLAMDVSAQQSAPPAPSSAPTETKPDQPASPSPATPPSGQMERQQTPPPTNNNTQIETRSERIVERETPGRIFGVDPMVALIVGAVLLIVIVVGLVAMGRRTEDVHHTHHRV